MRRGVPSCYRTTEDGFTIISADRHPQSFREENIDVYVVEDTLSGPNALTPRFNGIQGTYVEVRGGDLVAMVDVDRPAEVDARVGNAILPVEFIAADPGQRPYVQTTVAAGFYVSGSLTGGLGNQRDTVIRVTSRVRQSVDEMHQRRTAQTLATPCTQLDTFYALCEGYPTQLASHNALST